MWARTCNVEVVFKDGVGYDPGALIAATEGTGGRYDLRQIVRRPLGVLLITVFSILVLYSVVRRFDNRRTRR